MSLSRRNFLGALAMAAPAILTGAREELTHAQVITGGAPVITNYNSTGRALVVEGKTLLISLSFSSEVMSLAGSLPVQIQPASVGGQILTEPQELYFYPVGGRRVYRTILSAPLDAIPGSYPLRIGARIGGRVLTWSFPYTVERGVYRQTSLTLDENFSAPPPEIAARMRRDFETDVEIFRRVTPRKWTAAFIRPVSGVDNNNFGVRRTVNRTKRYRHIGLDFRAATGTPVQAVNDGTVALSTEQWTPGQTIIIDHGGSIFSKYNHLSERRVQTGQTVTRGQVIALSGSSGGQKSPPHLHLDILLNRTAVDPEDFMRTAAQLIAV